MRTNSSCQGSMYSASWKKSKPPTTEKKLSVEYSIGIARVVW